MHVKVENINFSYTELPVLQMLNGVQPFAIPICLY